MKFKIPFIQGSWCLTSEDSCTILQLKKVGEIGRRHFASVLIAEWRIICREKNIF